MNFSFHPEAESEFLVAIDYYESREPGLGCDFARGNPREHPEHTFISAELAGAGG